MVLPLAIKDTVLLLLFLFACTTVFNFFCDDIVNFTDDSDGE